MKVFIICILIIVLFVAENKFVLSFRRKSFGGNIRILHISDIHNSRKGKDNHRISDIAEKSRPDLIFITGDLISRTETDFTSAEILLKRLCDIAPVYMVFGNHEQSLPDKYLLEFLDMLAKNGVKLLTNHALHTNIKGRNLHIYGVMQKYSTYKKDGCYRNLDKFTINDMKSAVGNKTDGEVLLLAHNPLWAEVYAEWGADYTFCGHVHGGIVRLFGVGMLSPERKFFPKYSKGVYDVNGMKLCISGGIGKLRMFNPPEIVSYEI